MPRGARPLLWLGGAGLVLAAALDPRPWLEADIAALSLVPEAGKALDRELRTALGAPEAGHVVYVSGDSVQAVLEHQERIFPVLESVREQGGLEAFEAAAYLLPSIATPDGASRATAGREHVASGTGGRHARPSVERNALRAVPGRCRGHARRVSPGSGRRRCDTLGDAAGRFAADAWRCLVWARRADRAAETR